MREWAHHHRTDTVDDPVFRAAMRGCDSVSFVFSLEVTWSKIQKCQQEKEDQKALEELRALQELQEGHEEDGINTNEVEDAVKMVEKIDGDRGSNGDVACKNPDQEDNIAIELQDSQIEMEDHYDTKVGSVSMELEVSDAKGGSNVDPFDKGAAMLVDGSDDEENSNEAGKVRSSGDVEDIAVVTEETTSSSDGSAGGSASEPQASASAPGQSVGGSTQDTGIIVTSEEESSPVAKANLKLWDCGKCTYKNSTSKRKCDVCKTGRPQSEGCDNSKSCGTKRSRGSR
jgi:hypothetical protein